MIRYHFEICKRLFDMMVDGVFFIVITIFANGKMEKTVLSFFLREICISFFCISCCFSCCSISAGFCRIFFVFVSTY